LTTAATGVGSPHSRRCRPLPAGRAENPPAASILSDDAGTNPGVLINNEQRLWGSRDGTSARLPSTPANPDRVYDINHRDLHDPSTPAKPGSPVKGARPGGDDYHQLWINPKDSNRMGPLQRPGNRRLRRWRKVLEHLVQPTPPLRVYQRRRRQPLPLLALRWRNRTPAELGVSTWVAHGHTQLPANWEPTCLARREQTPSSPTPKMAISSTAPATSAAIRRSIYPHQPEANFLLQTRTTPIEKNLGPCPRFFPLADEALYYSNQFCLQDHVTAAAHGRKIQPRPSPRLHPELPKNSSTPSLPRISTSP